MIFKPGDLDQPRTWLREVVQFTLDEFVADPLNMQRAMTAMTVVYLFHERLFSHASQSGHAPAGSLPSSLEGFRAALARNCPSFQIVAQATADPGGSSPNSYGLAFSNIASSGRILELLGEEGTSVHRAVIVSKPKRQLIPLLEDVMAAYRRALDEYRL